MRNRIPKTAHYAQRVALAESRPCSVAPPGSFVHPIRINRTRHLIGDYPSRLMGKAMAFHSSYELLLCELLDLLLLITAFWTQPQSFKFMLDGKWHIYTPDAVVELASGVALMIEVKPSDRIDDRSSDAWIAIEEAIKEAGFGFAIASDDLLLTETLRDNLTALSRYRHYRFRQAELDGIATTLASRSLSVGELRRSLDQSCGDRLIEAAIFHRLLFVDLWHPITDDTIVSSTQPASSEFTDKLWSVSCAR